MPHLNSVTTLMAVGAGSRHETKKVNGISHFLEHMFFKGSRKYPTAEEISNLVDGIGAINNAGTDKEATFYWIKSANNHIKLASDILSSMLKEPLMADQEIEMEKGIITEEIRMYRDNPASFVWDLYTTLQFGDQPLGWDIGGSEESVSSFQRDDFLDYMDSLYSPENMALVYVGKLPNSIESIAEEYFLDLPKRSKFKFVPYQKVEQKKIRVDIFYKKTEQINVVLGVLAYDRYDKKRFAAKLLSTILGEGMSSRLFIQVREKRGLAYHVGAIYNPYQDTGFFASYAGLKLEKIEEGIEVIKSQMLQLAMERVTDGELKKAKEMEKGRIALRSESTNFLAEYFGVQFILDHEIESFEDYLKGIYQVTAQDILEVAQELFQKNLFNLQIIGPFEDKAKFEKLLSI